MEEEGRRTKEAVRNSIRTYGVKVMDPAAFPLKKTKETESQESVSRFSEKSLHSPYTCKQKPIKSFLLSVPFASLFAACVFFTGLIMSGIFARRLFTLIAALFDDVFDQETPVIGTIRMLYLGFELFSTTVGILVVICGYFATGTLRKRFYKKRGSKIGGAVFCGILMCLCFCVLGGWLLLFWCVAVAHEVNTVSKSYCENFEVKDEFCITIPHLQTLIFETPVTMLMCNEIIKNIFCTNYVDVMSSIDPMFAIGCAIAIAGTVLFFITLAANFVRIRCHTNPVIQMEDYHHYYEEEGKNRF